MKFIQIRVQCHFLTLSVDSFAISKKKGGTIMERIKNLEILQLIQELGLVETGETALAEEA